MFCNKIRGGVLIVLMALFFTGIQFSSSYAQSEVLNSEIDPRLFKIVEEVKLRASSPDTVPLQKSEPSLAEDNLAQRRIEMAARIQTSTYSKTAEKIRAAIRDFEALDNHGASPSLDKIVELYARHAEFLEANAPLKNQQSGILPYESQGSWLERYFAYRLSVSLYAEGDERQAALQKAQYAFQSIPKTETLDPYIRFARADITSTLTQLHTMQGNIDFAISNSMEYLRITKGERDPKTESDLLNNLVFVHALSRDHEALKYLSDELLKLSELSPSSIVGLSEFRVAQAANMAGNFQKGLEYARLATDKSEHSGIKLQAKINQAIALSGLGRNSLAIQVAGEANINLDDQYLSEEETRRDVLYLGFLLALGTDETLARDLYNRQLDVTAQKFLANSSRDTTAMVAELENSHERQAEREAAAARESELQAMTINRQRKLNRALTGISLLMGLALFTGLLFIRYRGKVLRKLEIKTREAASAEKLKTEFLGMISHELRTPLNGIIGISDFLANHHQDDDIRKKTSIVLESGYELLSVVEALTDMARIDAGQLQLLPHDADLAKSLAIIPEDWKEKAADKGLAFTAFIDPTITQHHVDEERVLQCINILMANAVSFTDAGRVHLHITASKTEPMSLTAIVADTGQGMSELVQSRLFTPFMQADTSRKRSHMGTGLSLAIAHALAEQMEGSLKVVSREGRGSEFTLTVPLPPLRNKTAQTLQSTLLPDVSAEEVFSLAGVAPAKPAVPVEPSISKPIEKKLNEAAPPEQQNPQLNASEMNGPATSTPGVIDLMQPSAQQKQSLHGAQVAGLPAPQRPTTLQAAMERPRRILIVDDIDSNRDILRLILETKGYICQEAADGRTALYALDHQSYDLVIMDIHMAPMDGVEAIERIRSSDKYYSDVPIIALTADKDPQINADCIQAGANLFLTKPVKQTELLRSIDLVRQSDSARILGQSA